MAIHFEELWNKCEEYHSSQNDDFSDLITQLTIKLGIYNAIDQKIEESSEEKNKAKSHLFGEILLSLTALSLKDNINVYDALNIALMQHNIELYSEKY